VENSDIGTVSSHAVFEQFGFASCLPITQHYTGHVYPGDVEIVRMLLSAFADTHITDDRSTYTRYDALKFHGHTEVLPYLQCTLSAIHLVFLRLCLPTTACQYRQCCQLKTLHNTTHATQTSSLPWCH
jgi:hypothetical protein